MDEFFNEQNDDLLSGFTTPEKTEKSEKRPPEFNRESRKNKVANFKLKIEDDDWDSPEEKKHDTVSNRPKSNGEVYFANYQRGGGNPAPRYTANQAQRTPNEESNLDSDLNMFSDNSTRARQPSDMPITKNPSNGKKKKTPISSEEAKKRLQAYSRTFYISLALVVVFTVILSVVGIKCVNDALALSASNEEIEVTIPDKITTNEAIDILVDKDLIDIGWFSKLFAAFRGYDKEGVYYYTVGGEKKLQPYVGGTYYLSSDMGVEGMLNILLDNSASSEQTVSITFPEGYTIAQIVARLEDYEVITDEKKFINASNYDYKYPFLDAENNGMPLKLEGYLFPDTYDVYIGESASSLVKRFLENFDEKWTDEYTKRAKELGYTTHEILTIASIIQKEAADAKQMPEISSVIHNRLKNSSYYPMLQCDSTELYTSKHLTDLLGKNKANDYADLYNTAICLGLPEGPICNPGIDAINAALYPAETNYMYFCHDKSGKVYYAATDLEHQRNIQKIR